MPSTPNHFISDMGTDLVLHPDEGEPRRLPRYGVWEVERAGRSQVVEVGDDLAALRERYGVTGPVVVIRRA